MKKMIIGLLFLILIVVVISKLRVFSKFSMPSEFVYEQSEAIDINYHNPLVLQDYYENIYRSSSFAKEQWYNFKINVEVADISNPKSMEASRVYESMLKTTKYLESKLIYSGNLKKLGLNNSEIKHIESSGENPEIYLLKKQLLKFEFKTGESGEAIKVLQQKLNELGYEMPVDGIYSTITTKGIIEFQKKNNLFPTGELGEETIIKIYFQNI